MLTHLKKIAMLNCLVVFACIPVSVSAADVVQRSVDDLLLKYSIEQPTSTLMAVVTNDTESNFGFMFDDGKAVHIYRNSSLIYKGDSGPCTSNPFLFSMTEDGHIISAADCTSLYFDNEPISIRNSALVNGKEITIYKDGQLLFPEWGSIKQI
jgi:hypothetical protein